VLAPKGFRAAGVACGIKAEGVLDLGLLVNDAGSAVAGTFTTNRVCAAPVKWSRIVTLRGRARACVVNSGNANACTGERGKEDAESMARLAGELLRAPAKEIVVASTGKIGVPLPMDAVARGIRAAAAELGEGNQYGTKFARAIMTTDAHVKESAVRSKAGFCVGGCTKGAGMIAPNMATMLAFITTDAVASPGLLRQCLSAAVARSFNRISVDGHTSTNDTVILMASGSSGVEAGERIELFQAALDKVAHDLALKIVADGEGATKVVEIEVVGTDTDDEADRIARAVACSPLVKTALHGADPNWGRIISAAGYSWSKLDETQVSVFLGSKCAFERGLPTGVPRTELAHELKGSGCKIRLVVGRGAGTALHWTCDLSKEYVAINAEYFT